MGGVVAPLDVQLLQLRRPPSAPPAAVVRPLRALAKTCLVKVRVDVAVALGRLTRRPCEIQTWRTLVMLSAMLRANRTVSLLAIRSSRHACATGARSSSGPGHP